MTFYSFRYINNKAFIKENEMFDGYFEVHLQKEIDLIPERADRLEKLLDDAIPNWRDSVDVDNLHIDCNCDCLTGQLFNSYTEAAPKLFGDSDSGVNYGVYAHPFLLEQSEYYEAATTHWRSRIRQYRTEVPALFAAAT